MFANAFVVLSLALAAVAQHTDVPKPTTPVVPLPTVITPTTTKVIPMPTVIRPASTPELEACIAEVNQCMADVQAETPAGATPDFSRCEARLTECYMIGA